MLLENGFVFSCHVMYEQPKFIVFTQFLNIGSSQIEFSFFKSNILDRSVFA